MFKRGFSLLLVFVLLASCAMPVLAAKKKEEKEPITISTVEELLVFAECCRLDSYSQGLTVQLEGDLDLTDTNFTAIPIFCGSFLGNGHTISGLTLTGEGSVQGLFRYVAEGAVVRDLTVKGTVQPTGSQSLVGGIAGSNAGQLLSCRFEGTVSGGDSIGGIVGENRVSGIIDDAAVSGVVYGNHFVGGIAGMNHGVIRGGSNRAEVNTTVQENEVKATDITIASLTGSESSNTVTDIGGIAGGSDGVIRSCKSYAAVGYPQIGYNIGGIAGTQSGYVDSCENRGNIQGRKEVGGIVGQMEPMSQVEYSTDTLQILEGQLNTLSSLTGQAANNAQSGMSAINGPLGEVSQQTEVVRDAIGVLQPGSGADQDSVLAAQMALSGAIRNMGESMSEVGSVAESTAASIGRDMRAITNQIDAMSATLENASETTGASYLDVSDEDTDEDLGGKVQACVNYGEVLGDRNIGGITGAMARENDLDESEDWSFEQNTSTNVSAELRAVITSCENQGAVSGSKQNIGGIVGWQNMGLVKNSMNLGVVVAEKADYVGGISGRSSGYIRGCSAKCTLSGATLLGGIAGSAGRVTDCRSLVELTGATERMGAILGIREEVDSDGERPIADNYYLATEPDYGAIDGISYAGQAEPKGMEEFLALKALAEPFRTVTLRFVYDSGAVKELQVPAGGSLSKQEIPEIPERKGYVSEWEGLSEVDLKEILFDMQFKAIYIGENTVLQSNLLRENGLPVMLAQGAFTSDGTLRLRESRVTPTVEPGQILRETWAVSVGEGQQVTQLRCLLPADMDGDHAVILVRSDGGAWREVTFHTETSYVVFDFTDGDVAVAIVETPTVLYVMLVLAIGALLLLWQYKAKRK